MTAQSIRQALPPLEPKRTLTGHQLVFAYGNLYQGLPCGFRNARLEGFERAHKGYASLKESEGDHVVGRVLAVTDEQLARMDTWAERSGDYHRFLADIIILPSGDIFNGVWVFQMTQDRTPWTSRTSANGEFREEQQ